MNDTATYALAALLLPPTSTALAALLGLALLRRAPRVGRALVALGAGALLLAATPAVAMALLRSLEPPPLDLAQARAFAPQAIVILGGGRSLGAPEWGGETVNAFTMQRVRYGAQLARELQLPLLVTGGTPGRGKRPEAQLMADLLRQEFTIAPRWIEDASLTTRDNARGSGALLAPDGITRVLLVTDAAHMPRALGNFSGRGLAVLPAPTGYLGQVEFAWNHLIPSVEGLRRTNIALREWLARARDALI